MFNKRLINLFYFYKIFSFTHRVSSHSYLSGIQIQSHVIPEDFSQIAAYNEWKFHHANHTIFVQKIVRKHLGLPYNQCNNYKMYNPFNSSSQTQCYRKCFREYFIQTNNCDPLFIDDYIHESELKYSHIPNLKMCDLVTSLESIRMSKYNLDIDLEGKCLKLCPKQCLSVEYTTTQHEYNINRDLRQILTTRPNPNQQLLWDNTKPMILYIETPIMSFTEYMVYCGGLLGLYSGLSANYVLIFVFDIKFWRFIHKIKPKIIKIIEILNFHTLF